MVEFEDSSKSFFDTLLDNYIKEVNHAMEQVLEGNEEYCKAESKIDELSKEVEHDDNPVEPEHYKGEGGDLLDAMENNIFTREEMIGAYKFNLIKYAVRFDKKNGIEDLDKLNEYSLRLRGYLENHEE